MMPGAKAIAVPRIDHKMHGHPLALRSPRAQDCAVAVQILMGGCDSVGAMKQGWLLLVALLCVAGARGSVPAAEGPIVPTLAIGAPAPDFDLPGVDGRRYSLKDFASAPVLAVVFTCNHCPTAQAYEDRIQKLHDDYAGKGVALVAISPNDPKAVRLDELGYSDLSDSLEEMKVRADDKGFTFPYLYDGET